MLPILPSVLRTILVVGTVLVVATPSATAEEGDPAPLDAAGAEQLVRAIWYEGLPAEEAARIGAEGGARLVELLADPAEQAIHANVLLALGHAAPVGAYEAIAAYADAVPVGEVDRATFRARQMIPHALGALVDHDPRAMARLGRELDEPSRGWTFRRFDAARVSRLRRRAAATSLAMTGRPEARAWLDGSATRSRGRVAADARFEAHLAASRELLEQRIAERAQ